VSDLGCEFVDLPLEFNVVIAMCDGTPSAIAPMLYLAGVEMMLPALPGDKLINEAVLNAKCSSMPFSKEIVCDFTKGTLPNTSGWNGCRSTSSVAKLGVKTGWPCVIGITG
jgi:hypothetical protein